MKKRRLINPIVVYILAQLAWFALLALWIYWYITNYLIFIDVGERTSPQFVISTKNIAALEGDRNSLALNGSRGFVPCA